MNAIGNKPVTKEDYLKRALALILDDAFIAASPKGANGWRTDPTLVRLNTYVAKDFDQLVDKLAAAAKRQFDNPAGV